MGQVFVQYPQHFLSLVQPRSAFKFGGSSVSVVLEPTGTMSPDPSTHQVLPSVSLPDTAEISQSLPEETSAPIIDSTVDEVPVFVITETKVLTMTRAVTRTVTCTTTVTYTPA